MKKHKKFQPYIRRANGNERAETLRLAIRLAFYEELGRPFFVMVQRGFPNTVMEVGASRHDLARLPLPVRLGKSSFRKWARKIQQMASGAR